MVIALYLNCNYYLYYYSRNISVLLCQLCWVFPAFKIIESSFERFFPSPPPLSSSSISPSPPPLSQRSALSSEQFPKTNTNAMEDIPKEDKSAIGCQTVVQSALLGIFVLLKACPGKQFVVGRSLLVMISAGSYPFIHICLFMHIYAYKYISIYILYNLYKIYLHIYRAAVVVNEREE